MNGSAAVSGRCCCRGCTPVAEQDGAADRQADHDELERDPPGTRPRRAARTGARPSGAAVGTIAAISSTIVTPATTTGQRRRRIEPAGTSHGQGHRPDRGRDGQQDPLDERGSDDLDRRRSPDRDWS